MDWTKGPIEAHERHMTRPIIRLIEDDVRATHDARVAFLILPHQKVKYTLKITSFPPAF